MMSEGGEPRWELLPDNPVGFFELAGAFDRKTLKRRYTDLIRRFKPEKHPSEFQQIRSAFEALDARLRSGQPERPGPTAFRYHWSSDESTINPPELHKSLADPRHLLEQPVEREPKQAVSLIRRLETEAPLSFTRSSSNVSPNRPITTTRWPFSRTSASRGSISGSCNGS